MTTETKQNPAGERMEEPAKSWINWFIVVWEGGVRGARGNVAKRGDVVTSNRKYPSKDAAKTDAAMFMSLPAESKGLKYLGAFPEGQRP